MKIKKAIITAAAPDQRKLPLQTLIDRDRTKKTVLEILINEIRSAGIDEIGIVIQPDDEKSFEQALGAVSGPGIKFIPQSKSKPGYGNAILCGKEFLNGEPFLHLVGDHLYVNRKGENVAGQLIKLAEQSNCPVSAVQPTRENLIGNYGTIKAIRIQGETDLFQIKKVTEKPTPAYAAPRYRQTSPSPRSPSHPSHRAGRPSRTSTPTPPRYHSHPRCSKTPSAS